MLGRGLESDCDFIVGVRNRVGVFEGFVIVGLDLRNLE